MASKRETAFITDWQLPFGYGTELTDIRETDGNEEDQEFRFYSLPDDDNTYLNADLGF